MQSRLAISAVLTSSGNTPQLYGWQHAPCFHFYLFTRAARQHVTVTQLPTASIRLFAAVPVRLRINREPTAEPAVPGFEPGTSLMPGKHATN